MFSGQGGREVNGIISDAFMFFYYLSIIGILISIICCGIKLGYTKNPSAREEVKKELLWKAVLAVVMFGFTFFAGIAYGISKSII